MADLTGLLPSPGTKPWNLNPAITAVNGDVETRLLAADAPELIRDTIGAALVEGTGIDITVNDEGDQITIAATGGASPEEIFEVLSDSLVEGTGIDLAIDSVEGTITITATGGGGGSVSEWGDLTGDIDAQTDLQEALDGKSDTGHGHAISDVTNLQTTLDGKAASSHTHGVGDLTATGTATADTILHGDNSWKPIPGAAWGGIDGDITEQLDLWSQIADSPIQVRHNDDADYPRPVTTRPVYWIGSVAPNNRDNSLDTWFEVDSSSTFVGAFDDYATPYQAYSLRRLLTSYTGPAIRVRRSSDNAEQDIGFTSSGDLNTSALATFADSDSVYVKTWYDQSGSGRDVTQATAANQPRIVNAGTIDTAGGKPAVVFDGTNDYLSRTASNAAGLYASGATTAAFIMQAVSDTSDTLFSEHGTGTSSIYRIARSSTANWNVQATQNLGTSLWASSASGSNLFDNNRHQGFYVDGSGIINTWKDGTQAHNNITATRSGTLDITAFTIGAHASSSPGGYITGNVQEAIFWGSALSASRTAISAEQKTYWGTP